MGDNVFIGARTIIMPNVTIGNNCIIAAGRIVTKDVPNNTVIGVLQGLYVLWKNTMKSIKHTCWILLTIRLKKKKEYY